jgi:hypothetical protein
MGSVTSKISVTQLVIFSKGVVSGGMVVGFSGQPGILKDGFSSSSAISSSGTIDRTSRALEDSVSGCRSTTGEEGELLGAFVDIHNRIMRIEVWQTEEMRRKLDTDGEGKI